MTIYQCPRCSSRDVRIDATSDVLWNPTTETIEPDPYGEDNIGGHIRCQKCSATNDYATEWEIDEE